MLHNNFSFRRQKKKKKKRKKKKKERYIGSQDLSSSDKAKVVELD
jgi:hypothetical protein